MTVNYIVVHAGKAHNDDLLAVAFALKYECDDGPLPRVYRRDPTPAELEDPEVLVLDVGGQHNQALNNFDHHQLDRNAPPACAVSLYLAHKDPAFLAKLRRFTKWFDTVELIDSKGPFAFAKANGLKEFPFGLIGAVEAPVKEIFEETTELGHDYVAGWVCQLLFKIAESHIKFVEAKAKAFDELATKALAVEENGVPGLLYMSKDTDALQQYRDERIAAGKPALAFSITLDDRGDGYSLYRFNDDVRIDFSRLEGNPLVTFAHKGGFIAKTKNITVPELMALVQLALK